jgi:phage-related protein (TIGR01555 family)
MAGFFKRAATTVVEAARKTGFFAAGEPRRDEERPNAYRVAEAILQQARDAAPLARAVGGFDGCATGSSIKSGYGMGNPYIGEALLGFFLRSGFIGHQIAALLSQHWLIDKACTMPARDASRQGFNIVGDDGGEVDAAIVQQIRKADERFKLNDHLLDFVRMGRVFGIRVALFKIESTDPKFYEYPFNPDAITPGSYKGIVQIDPYWISPELDSVAVSDPASLRFYEPTWWMIAGKRYHHSHLVVFRTGEVPDILKPQYLYGGKPVPQLIIERVYNAERTANEAPQLAMTKRTTTFATDTAEAFADIEKFNSRLREWTDYRDNFAVKVLDKEGDEMQQFDTSLSDLDAIIMTGYQIVAAAANVPATKLLGTTPKGFNSTGEYEEASYHEELESIQTHDLTPLVERHHVCVMRSIIAPANGGKITPTSVVWNPLDSPTAKEEAETQKIQADRDKSLVDAGAISGDDVRERLAKDRSSGYHGIELLADEEPLPTTGEPGVAAPGPVPAQSGDAMDPVRLVTNQRFVDPTIVEQKILAADFTVQVSPLFVTEAGERYRIVIDGHHSLAAANKVGVPPVLVEGDYTGSDYEIVAGA